VPPKLYIYIFGNARLVIIMVLAVMIDAPIQSCLLLHTFSLLVLVRTFFLSSF